MVEGRLLLTLSHAPRALLALAGKPDFQGQEARDAEYLDLGRFFKKHLESRVGCGSYYLLRGGRVCSAA